MYTKEIATIANRIAIDLLCNLEVDITINQSTITECMAEGMSKKNVKIINSAEVLVKSMRLAKARLKNLSDDLVNGVNENAPKEIERVKFYYDNNEIENYKR